MTFRHGDPVTLDGRKGTLYLPLLTMYGHGRTWDEPQQTTGGYGVHTIILEDGSRFRTEGRLS